MDRIPCQKTLYLEVKNIKEAKIVLNTLTKRDLNDERITDNVMGLEEFTGNKQAGEWSEYYNEDGENIDEIIN